ncbi:MAG: hypothetical protein MZV49_20115 [Rhodopseudomonas palustris]|nr:hypothetical protein [Rhodopseudomonas palustris]
MTSIANSTSSALSRSPAPDRRDRRERQPGPCLPPPPLRQRQPTRHRSRCSDQAKALLQLQKDLSMTFEERLQKRSDALAEKSE